MFPGFVRDSLCHEYRGEKDRDFFSAAEMVRDAGWKISASPRKRLVGGGFGESGDVGVALVAGLDCERCWEGVCDEGGS